MPRFIITGANERRRSPGLCRPLSPRKRIFKTGSAANAEQNAVATESAKHQAAAATGIPVVTGRARRNEEKTKSNMGKRGAPDSETQPLAGEPVHGRTVRRTGKTMTGRQQACTV